MASMLSCEYIIPCVIVATGQYFISFVVDSSDVGIPLHDTVSV